MSLGCAQCGHCCEVIHVAAGALARLEYDAWSWDAWLGLDDATMDALARLDWDMPDWRESRDSIYRDFYGVLFYWRRHYTSDTDYGAKDVFTCDAFDPVARTCGIHDHRPRICSAFPFYDREPDWVGVHPGTALDAAPYDCSYWLDVPGWSRRRVRPLLPVEVLR